MPKHKSLGAMGEQGGAALRRRLSTKMQGPDGHADTDTDAGTGTGRRRRGIPPATWTRARPNVNNGLPQAVAHRGYKASFPENTMEAFRGAVEVGAHAIETDVHLSKDGVVVIAHDKDLKRCYGVDKAVRDCEWDYLCTLKTLKEPRQNMCRLADLLEYLAEPRNEAVWVLLDIKVDDPARDMVPRLAATIASAPSGGWARRIVLGCWRAEHLRLCHELFPGFAIAYIGIPAVLAREYAKIPNVAITLRQESLFGFDGRPLREHCQSQGRPLYAWTVNKTSWMEWCIGSKVDCVITDDPKLYLEVCDRHRRGRADSAMVKRINNVVTKPRDVLLSVFYWVLLKTMIPWLRVYERFGRPEEVREELKVLT